VYEKADSAILRELLPRNGLIDPASLTELNLQEWQIPVEIDGCVYSKFGSLRLFVHPLVQHAVYLPQIVRPFDGKVIAVIWMESKSEQAPVHLMWATSVGGRTRTFALRFDGQLMLKWIDSSKAIAVRITQETGSRIYILKTEDGAYRALLRGISSFVTVYAARFADTHDGIPWQDMTENTWIDVYDSEGQRIHHFLTNYSFLQTGFISPEGHLAIYADYRIKTKNGQVQQLEIAISAANEPQRRTLRSGLIGLRNILWSPDGKLIAFGQSSAPGKGSLEVFTSGGVSVASFEAGNGFTWTANCTSHR
jgi:hypothetical protein